MDKIVCPKCGNEELMVVSESVYPGLYACSNCEMDIRKCKKCSNGVLTLLWGPIANKPLVCNSCYNKTDKSGVPHSGVGGGDGGRGCYVATCVYGSYDSREVRVLRHYRDGALSKTVLGRLFIDFYYLVSPSVVRFLGNKKWFVFGSKIVLDKVVKKLEK